MDRIRISREETEAPKVDEVIEHQRAILKRLEVPEAAEVSPLRRVLLSSMFYLPLAGLLGAFITWAILEPYINDTPSVGGQVALVNSEPFDLLQEKGVSITVGPTEVVYLPQKTRLERGADGQAAFTGVDDLIGGTNLEATGIRLGPHRLVAMAIRPATEARAKAVGHAQIEDTHSWALYSLFPITAGLIVLFLTLFEGLSTRNWLRMIQRTSLATLLGVVFACLAFIPAGLMIMVPEMLLKSEANTKGFATVHNISTIALIAHIIGRSGAWACITTAMGLGMNLVRSTRLQLRNSVFGGMLGGALGGMFFDPIDRFLHADTLFAGSGMSRLVGLLAVGFCVGIFMALVERMGRDAWIRVCTGPLAGKSFILYRSPTTIGSSPQADIYLFKDPEIDPSHLAIHKVGTSYEAEDLNTRHGTTVGGDALRRKPLVSGDQICLGGTILQFEERASRVYKGSGS